MKGRQQTLCIVVVFLGGCTLHVCVCTEGRRGEAGHWAWHHGVGPVASQLMYVHGMQTC